MKKSVVFYIKTIDMYGYRNYILKATLIISGIFILSLIVFLFLLNLSPAIKGTNLPEVSNPFWFLYAKASISRQNIIWNIICLFITIVFVFIISIILKTLYYRTASPEIFFFILFLFSFLFESSRIWIALLYINKFPIVISVILTRIIHFGRIFGIICLFFSSIYAFEINYYKFGILITIIMLISLTFAYTLPIDSSVLMTNFILKIGDEKGIFFTTLAFKMFILLNFVIARFVKNKNGYGIRGLLILIILIGREFLIFFYLPFSMIGIALIIGATLMFIRNIDKHYLWS